MKERHDRDLLVHTRGEELERAGTLAVHDVDLMSGADKADCEFDGRRHVTRQKCARSMGPHRSRAVSDRRSPC